MSPFEKDELSPDTGHCLLVITGTPALEETLVDWLLRFEGQYGFTRYGVSGHSSRHAGLTLAEQVSGRKKQIRFEMQVPQSEVMALIDQLRQDFANSGLHFWVTPVIACGRI